MRNGSIMRLPSTEENLMNIVSTCLVIVACGACAGCHQNMHDCVDYFEPPTYQIGVVDSMTGQPICDATVEVNGIACSRTATGCTFSAGIPTGEAVTITAKRDGYASKSENVSTHFSTDSCNQAIPVDITISLSKQ